MTKETSIHPEDFKLLKSILGCEIGRNARNPTNLFINLLERGLRIISEHVSEDAPRVKEERTR